MKIVGIETSCDETAIAILEITGKKNPQFRILANVVSSQTEIHRPYGGVYPSLAKREHEKNLPFVLEKSLKHAKVEPLHIDSIAVTVGPGLDPCLWTGIEFAKDLAKKMGIPLVPVDHMEGHLLVSLFLQGNEKSTLSSDRVPRRMTGQMPNQKKTFPAVALLVSGGHTQLVLMKGIGKYKVIGETRDDAAGECFDKTARVLGLPYPGGPAIAATAALSRDSVPNLGTESLSLPRPMLNTKDYDFSFSGLKTAVLYDYQSRPKKIQKSQEYIRAMAKEIQQSIVDVLISKTVRAAQAYNAKCVILGGGVAANEELRRQLPQILNTRYQIPVLAGPKELCTDNGLMPALAGFFNLSKKKQGAALNRIAAQPNLRLE